MGADGFSNLHALQWRTELTAATKKELALPKYPAVEENN